MIRAIIEFKNSRLSVQCEKANLNDWRKITAKDQKQFQKWIDGYRHALQNNPNDNRGVLLHIGREIYQWLNGTGGWLDRFFKSSPNPPFILEFNQKLLPGAQKREAGKPGSWEVKEATSNQKLLPGVQGEGFLEKSPPGSAFLEVPWELLADKNRFLAEDQYFIYCPVRRLGEPTGPAEPSLERLHTVFMAAAPGGSVDLKYEEEESAVLEAAGSIGMDLIVEESGTPRLLAECMAREKPVDVLHISCHGTKKDGEIPALLLETDDGSPSVITADELAQTLGGNKPRLLFLSACMTSEPDSLVNSLAADLVRQGLAAVLGWGGSVKDSEATRFARAFYGYLSRCEDLEEAVARSRLELFEKDKDKDKKDPLSAGSRDWHLARLYLGESGGGVLCRGKTPRRRRGMDYGHKEFLNTKDSKIPVAGRAEFVGRRRQIQKILKEFNSPAYAGVLVHGFGRQGKSSLAARIAHRMPDHRLVVVYGNYDALSILEAIEYFAGTAELNTLVDRQKAGAAANPDRLFILLKEILEGPFPSLLLVIDDLEQVLEDPRTGELHRVNSEVLDTLRAVIAAFAAVGENTGSRLLITSRYRFTLPYKGRDLASRLLPLHLLPMEEYEGRKQASAKERQLGEAGERVEAARRERCIGAARGNPGLQDLLFGLCLKAPGACDQALEAVEAFVAQGTAPDQETLLEFIRGLAVDRLLGLLSKSEQDLLRAVTLFSIPIPLETLVLLAREMGIEAGEVFGDRLFGFGLWEPFDDMVNPGKTAAAIHGLVRGKAGQLTEAEKKEIAGLVVPDLFERWWGKDRKKRTFAAAIELAGLALLAKDTNVLAETAEDAVRGLEQQFQYRSAAKLAREAIETLDNANVGVPAGLLRAGAELSQQIGDMKMARAFIQRAIAALSSSNAKETADYAYALVAYGRMLVDSGEPDEALKIFQEARDRLHSDENLRERSTVLGEIARILKNKGQVEEALKLHQEMLKVFEELGDRRSRAVTLGDIARILKNKGQVEEALKLHQEVLIIFEELGDLVGKANTLWYMAGIELQRESFQTAFDYLSESYAINLKLGRLDGICMVGLDLGQLLCISGNTESGLEILERSRSGFLKLCQANLAQQTQQLMEMISKDQKGKIGT